MPNSDMVADPVINRDKRFLRIFTQCKDFTMTSRERMYALYKSVAYIISAKIPGDLVECGVWKGGSTMLIAMTLLELKEKTRKIYLYDTFKGMSEPTNKDYHLADKAIQAKNKWESAKAKGYVEWCFSPLAEVKNNLVLTKYPQKNLVFIKGEVEKNIPKTTPAKIALLRLDTDWYESTKHELIHLFPLVSRNGVLIIDDYGYWAGSKKAVDEYFAHKPILLNRIDESSSMGVKIQ